MLLSDWEIRNRVLSNHMIDDFVDRQVRVAGKEIDGESHGLTGRVTKEEKVISYGLSSYGYDARLASEFKVFTNVDNVVVDPKNFDSRSFVERTGDFVIIPPNSFILGRTVEYFRIPNDVLVICLGKSTYARCGLIVNVTPLEPGWEGYVTIEVSNSTPLPAKVYAQEGICQFIFMRGESVCHTSYADKNGKYQFQKGITIPRM